MKKFIMGFIIGGLLFGATGVYAAEQFKKAYVKEWGFNVCGEPVELTSKIVTIDGSSYLPVKEVAKNLGYEVSFNSNTKEVEANIYRTIFPSESCKFKLVHESEIEEKKNSTLIENSTNTTHTVTSDVNQDSTTNHNTSSNNSNVNSNIDSSNTNSNNNNSYTARYNAELTRHDNRVKELEKEYTDFKKIVDQQIQKIKVEGVVGNYSKDNYDRLIKELTNNQLDLQKKLSVLFLDDSYEGIKKKADLEKQIDEIESEKTIIQDKYSRQLRVEALETQLKDRKEHIDKLIEEENKIHQLNLMSI